MQFVFEKEPMVAHFTELIMVLSAVHCVCVFGIEIGIKLSHPSGIDRNYYIYLIPIQITQTQTQRAADSAVCMAGRGF